MMTARREYIIWPEFGGQDALNYSESHKQETRQQNTINVYEERAEARKVEVANRHKEFGRQAGGEILSDRRKLDKETKTEVGNNQSGPKST